MGNPGKKAITFFGIVFVTAIGYFLLGYFLPRHLGALNIIVYTTLFASYIWLFLNQSVDISTGIKVAIFFRVILLFSIPALSDDFYRFIWDGRLLNYGINPFDEPPDYYLGLGILNQYDLAIYHLLNFTQYHSLYAPVPQFTQWFSVSLAGSAILWTVFILRLFVLGAEISSIFLIRYLLGKFQLPSRNVLLYALNPLVILELTGNLHHEAFVILFILIALALYSQRRFILSSISMGFAIGSKLIPLIFLPLFLMKLGWTKGSKYISLSVLVSLLLFLPFVNTELASGLLESSFLYFQKFEFNASVYYLVREVGYWVKGYNIIQTAGPWLALITFAAVLGFSFFAARNKVELPEGMMWVLLIYIALGTTIHPWYVVPMVMLAGFTRYTFPYVWSFFIFFSYLGYTPQGYDEQMHLVAMEYLVVYGWMGYELFNRRNPLPLWNKPIFSGKQP